MAITDALQVKNALQSWPFRFEFNGYPPFLVQKCKIPEIEFEVVEYGGAGQTVNVKEAGGKKIAEITLESIIPARGEERTYWDTWEQQCQTRDTQTYYRDGTITLLGPNDEPSMFWDIEDAWPSKIEMDEFDSEDKGKKAIVKVTLQCNDIKKRVA